MEQGRVKHAHFHLIFFVLGINGRMQPVCSYGQHALLERAICIVFFVSFSYDIGKSGSMPA